MAPKQEATSIHYRHFIDNQNSPGQTTKKFPDKTKWNRVSTLEENLPKKDFMVERLSDTPLLEFNQLAQNFIVAGDMV